MKLGFFGGSFNPPHNGHKMIIENCVDFFDKFLVIPNKVSPHKINELSINSIHRTEMLNLIIDRNKVEVDLFEINSKDHISYTCDTIKYLKAKYNNFSLTMIIGEDQLYDLKEWYNYEYIIENVNIFCFKRLFDKVSNQDDMDFKIKKDLKKYNNTFNFFNFVYPCSSTEIRNNVKLQQSIASNLVPKEILTYITTNGLYR
tara:strand:+ start:58 stop:660 length:603 start_codon:yes stop_codon:yes gene_type:complete